MSNSRNILFQRHTSNPILTANDWPYSVHAVFNPGATILPTGETLLIVTCEDFKGFRHLTIAKSKDGISNWEIDEKPLVGPSALYKKGECIVEPMPCDYYGCKDARITWFEELKKWAITYVSVTKMGSQISLITTDDFVNFERIGCIMPPQNKDSALFPKKFNDKWILVNRPTYSNEAHVWLSYSPDLHIWGDHNVLFKSRKGGWWDILKIGIGPPPIETDEGWLILYHGVRETASGNIYRIGLALLDKDNPAKVLHRTDEWVFGPKENYEREGNVDDRVFPCGTVVDRETNIMKMYYGAADTVVAVAIADIDALIDAVLKYSPVWS